LICVLTGEQMANKRSALCCQLSQLNAGTVAAPFDMI